ncbi:MAG: hypothetical protein G01um101413_828 [Parcubacteria group bacterium Gr01-1014_13]|nr:MAG: hypothetical protein G01um101413_828 [Parcubacteria group bacterium Gr01-1014_13]
MSEWKDVTEDLQACFSFPCKEHYYFMRRIGLVCWCDKPNEKHGHIELVCEDGYGLVLFPIYSQAGAKVVIEFIKGSEEERKGILGLAELKVLPEELTEEEKLVIASPDEMEKLARIKGWYN